ncbi:MAG TPA: tetratricopeptide repeat protein [Candidatus Acidoferrales bacterium]|nr:tetratricopeptide repeat protein [Candidatus Acidoferrales bacterium]
MRHLALFAIPLVLAAGAARAQQVPNAPIGTTAESSANQPGQPPAMTPRQVAVMRAEILMARKDYAEAVGAYTTLLRDDPKNATMLNQLGIAYQQLHEDDQAAHFYKKAIRTDKKYSSALNNLGTLEYGNNHYGKAIKYYKRALDTGENLSAVYSNLGYAYCAIKEFPLALESFRKAIALDPNVFESKSGAGTVLQQRSTPDPGALNFLLAKSYARMGEVERTARYLKIARDDGYKNLLSAEKDPDFARVIKDPRVQEVLRVRPPFADQPDKPVSN